MHFLIAIILLCTFDLSRANAQHSVRDSSRITSFVTPKDPQLATILGVIMPGAGQLYAGRPIKGGLLIAGFSGAIIGGVATSCFGCCSYYERSRSCEGNLTPYYTGLAVAAGLWIYGFATSASDAEKTNRKNLRRLAISPLVSIGKEKMHVGFSFELPKAIKLPD